MLILASLVGPDGAIAAVVYLAIVVAVIVGTVKIISKAGYSGWFVLLALVPLVNIVMFFVFAFSDWPVQKEIRRYRQGGYGVGPGGYPPPPWLPPPSPGYGSGPAGYGSGPAGYGSGPAGYGSGPAQAPPSSWQPPSGGQTPPAPGGSESPAPGSATSWQAPPPPPEPGG